MTVYSYIMGSIVLQIGDQIYPIQGPDKVVIKLPEGDYPFLMYFAYSDGAPIIKQTFTKRYDGGTFTMIYPAFSGTLRVSAKAEMNIRASESFFRGVKGYVQYLPEFETVNCELTDCCHGFLDEFIPKRLIRGCRIKAVLCYILALIWLAMGVTFTVLLAGVLSESAPMTENQFLDILPMLLSPILSVITIAQTTRNLQFIKICKNIPILNIPNEVTDYDDL